ncbi:hypothetical protein ATO67_18190 [Agrobacterium bohemicum]|uniref:Uncharacterized protein n=2 Tax=Agrobacterium bohemicum TaxID=2052828 RepID=A0A135P830_9HYPH|nr:hypothetical protein ATO67_18190 [Agrobacterium bohemicum]
MMNIGEEFTWTNCGADISKYANTRTITDYLKHVIGPAILSIENKIEEYEALGDAYAIFGVSDLQNVKRETLLAFSLGMQSLWERQFRNYLRQSASELKPNDKKFAERSKGPKWDDLEKLFEELRGVELKRFKSYYALNTLNRLGNAARHGDGYALQHLRKNNPELFPLANKFSNEAPLEIMQIHLKDFASAICSFWNEMELVRLRSLTARDTRISKAIEDLVTDINASFPLAAIGGNNGSSEAVNT